jgi:methylated-DNA-protein-cysteine methyltransferase-like protein
MSREPAGNLSDSKQNENARIHAKVLRVIRTIPPGRVSTYGSIAEALDLNPRRVARVLAHDPRAAKVPWYRVVGSGGRLAILSAAGRRRQAQRLRAEGIEVRANRVANFRALFFAA